MSRGVARVVGGALLATTGYYAGRAFIRWGRRAFAKRPSVPSTPPTPIAIAFQTAGMRSHPVAELTRVPIDVPVSGAVLGAATTSQPSAISAISAIALKAAYADYSPVRDAVKLSVRRLHDLLGALRRASTHLERWAVVAAAPAIINDAKALAPRATAGERRVLELAVDALAAGLDTLPAGAAEPSAAAAFEAYNSYWTTLSSALPIIAAFLAGDDGGEIAADFLGATLATADAARDYVDYHLDSDGVCAALLGPLANRVDAAVFTALREADLPSSTSSISEVEALVADNDGGEPEVTRPLRSPAWLRTASWVAAAAQGPTDGRTGSAIATQEVTPGSEFALEQILVVQEGSDESPGVVEGPTSEPDDAPTAGDVFTSVEGGPAAVEGINTISATEMTEEQKGEEMAAPAGDPMCAAAATLSIALSSCDSPSASPLPSPSDAKTTAIIAAMMDEMVGTVEEEAAAAAAEEVQALENAVVVRDVLDMIVDEVCGTAAAEEKEEEKTTATATAASSTAPVASPIIDYFAPDPSVVALPGEFDMEAAKRFFLGRTAELLGPQGGNDTPSAATAATAAPAQLVNNNLSDEQLHLTQLFKKAEDSLRLNQLLASAGAKWEAQVKRQESVPVHTPAIITTITQQQQVPPPTESQLLLHELLVNSVKGGAQGGVPPVASASALPPLPLPKVRAPKGRRSGGSGTSTPSFVGSWAASEASTSMASTPRANDGDGGMGPSNSGSGTQSGENGGQKKNNRRNRRGNGRGGGGGSGQPSRFKP